MDLKRLRTIVIDKYIYPKTPVGRRVTTCSRLFQQSHWGIITVVVRSRSVGRLEHRRLWEMFENCISCRFPRSNAKRIGKNSNRKSKVPAARASKSNDRRRFRDTMKHLVQRLETIVEPERRRRRRCLCCNGRPRDGRDGKINKHHNR